MYAPPKVILKVFLMRLPDISWLPGPTSFREAMCLNLAPCGSLGPVCARLRGGGTAFLGAARLYAPGPGIPRVPFTSNAPPSRRSVVDKKGFDFDFVPRSTISSNESFLTYCVAGGFMRASARGAAAGQFKYVGMVRFVFRGSPYSERWKQPSADNVNDE